MAITNYSLYKFSHRFNLRKPYKACFSFLERVESNSDEKKINKKTFYSYIYIYANIPSNKYTTFTAAIISNIYIFMLIPLLLYDTKLPFKFIGS